MKTATFYKEGGRIVSVVSGPENCVAATAEDIGYNYVFGTGNIETDYVRDGRIEARPPCPAEISQRVLSSLPVPCTIKVRDVEYSCTDGTAELEFDQPGSYLVIVQAWPYLDKEFTIENPA
jgi:hypothetical protein